MRTSRRATLLAVVFSIGLGGAVQAETLAEAIALAYETNPNLLQQRSSLRNSDETYFRASRTLGPAIELGTTVSGSAAGTIGDGGDPSVTTTTSLSIAQPIYSGGRLSSQLEAQEQNLLSARESLRRVEQTVMQNVVQAYVGVLRAEQALSIQQESVRVLQLARDEAQARYEVGASTRTDLANADTRLANARSSMVAAQTSLFNAHAQYRTVVGKQPENLEPTPALDHLLPASELVAFDIAQQNNPTLRAAYLAERSSAAQIAVARAALRPQVSLTGGADHRIDSGGFEDMRDVGLSASARISIPIFTGFTTQSQIRSAVESNRSDQIGIVGQRRAVQQQVVSAWNNLASARQQIISQREAERAAILAAEGTREEQQVGLKTTLDVLNAEQDLRQTQLALINATFNEYTATVELLAAMGQLNAHTFNPNIPAYDPEANFNEVNDWGFPWEPAIKALDRIGAPSIPKRMPIAGEVVPTFEDID